MRKIPPQDPERQAYATPPGTPLFPTRLLMAELQMPVLLPDQVESGRLAGWGLEPENGGGFRGEFDDWEIEWFGLVKPWDDPDRPPPWPALFQEHTRGGPDRWIQLRLERAWRVGSPLAAERRWRPDLGYRDAIIGLERPHEDRDLIEARRGFALLDVQAKSAGGRPKGSRKYPTKAAFVDAIRALYRDANGQKWDLRNVEDGWIARRLDIGRSTLYGLMGEHKITLDDIRQQRV